MFSLIGYECQNDQLLLCYLCFLLACPSVYVGGRNAAV